MKWSNVKVCIRTKPTQFFAHDNISIDRESNTIQIDCKRREESAAIGGPNNKQSLQKFIFDHIFHNSSQTDVYHFFAQDTVQGVIDGINGAIMSYGQTGSGKSFTMIGDTQNFEHRGIVPRAVNHIFREVKLRMSFDLRVSCTYCEIYNEKIYDLLADLSNFDQAVDYIVAEDKDGRGIFVRGLSEIFVEDETEALNLLFRGELFRTTATHKLNRKSNRSHSIFTIYLQQSSSSEATERVVHSKLHMVDLAGSERLKKTLGSADGIDYDAVTTRESMQINQSLTYLEQCIIALSRKSHNFIPYRQSKLTNILKDCLGANSNTLMLACVWGEATHIEETVSTLRLASRMMQVQSKIVIIETLDSTALIKKQVKLIKALKQDLLMHDALVERTGVSYEPYTPEQQTNIAQMLRRYVASSDTTEEEFLHISTYRQMIEVCKQFKKLVLDARTAAAAAGASSSSPRTTTLPECGTLHGEASGERTSARHHEADPGSKIQYVGVAGETASGFPLGNSLQGSRPLGGVEYLASSSARSLPAVAVASIAEGAKHQSMFEDRNTIMNRGYVSDALAERRDGEYYDEAPRAFDTSRVGDSKLYERLEATKAEMKGLECRSKELCQAVNEAKANIDKLQKQLELHRISRVEMLHQVGLKGSFADSSSKEDSKLIEEIKEQKRSYRNDFAEMQKCRDVLAQSRSYLEVIKNDLVTARSAVGEGRAQTARSRFSSTTASGPGSKAHTFGRSDTYEDQWEGEYFNTEEERVTARHPDGLAFYHAQKANASQLSQNSHFIKQMLKNKRL